MINFIVSALVAALISIGSYLGFTSVSQPSFPQDWIKRTETIIARRLDQSLTEWDRKIQQLVDKYLKLSLKDLQIFGATLPIAGTTYNLSGAGVTSSATSLTLQSLTLPQNGYTILDADLSDTFYITLEPGSRSRQEIVSCTTVVQNAAGTATLSGCSRGLSPITPFTASTTLQFAHGGGTQVIFSDPPQLFRQFLALDTDNQRVSGLVSFTDPPVFINSATSSSQGASITYVDTVALKSAPVAATTTNTSGIVRLAEPIEAATTSAANVHSTTSPLTVSSFLTFSDPDKCKDSATSTFYCIPMTRADGFLDQNFLATSAPYTWSGTHVFSKTASTTVSNDRLSYDLGVAGQFLVGATTTTGSLFSTSTWLKIGSQTYEFPATAGTANQVLQEVGTGGTTVKLGWVDNNTTVVSYFGRPLWNVSTTTSLTSSDNTVMQVAAFSLPYRIVVNRITVRVDAFVTAGTFNLLVYSENGQTRNISVTTGTVNATGNVSTTVSPAVTLTPGIYYFGILPNGTANADFIAYVCSAAHMLDNVSTKPLYCAQVTGLSAGVPPTTITPTSLTGTANAVIFRLDN